MVQTRFIAYNWEKNGIHELKLNWFPNDYAKIIYSHQNISNNLKKNMIFTLPIDSKSDTNKGDSGGPIIYTDKNNNKKIIGIVSFECILNKNCPVIRYPAYPINYPYPGGNTNVVYFKNWIYECIKNNIDKNIYINSHLANTYQFINPKYKNYIISIIDNRGNHICCGSVIDLKKFNLTNYKKMFFLTAAHCLSDSGNLPSESGNSPNNQLYVRFHANNFLSPKIPIVQVLYPNNYCSPEQSQNGEPFNDISLIRICDKSTYYYWNYLLSLFSDENGLMGGYEIADKTNINELSFETSLGFKNCNGSY